MVGASRVAPASGIRVPSYTLRVDTAARISALAAHEAAVADCVACSLCEDRTQVVVGSGSADAELMLVGEAPGFHEDRRGAPFVGQEAILVDSLLARIGLRREEVYCTTVVKCRPPAGRDPLDDEIVACETHLFRQLDLVRPKVVAAFGDLATRLLTGRLHRVTTVSGIPQELVVSGRSVVVLPLYDPAATLYSAVHRARLEVDFALIASLLGRQAEPAAVSPEPAAVPVLDGETVQLGLF